MFKQQPITAVEREQQSGHAAPKQPPIAKDWAYGIVQLLHDRLIVVQVSDPPAAQRDRSIAQIGKMCTTPMSKVRLLVYGSSFSQMPFQ